MPTRILLVEDNPGDAVIFREKLNASDLDYELVHAKRLADGLEHVANGRFDILMVDLSLPDAQGMEAVERVRAAAPGSPLMVLTGLDDATAAAEAKKKGAVDYLVKWYVDSISLARYIRYAIAQYRMFEGEVLGPEGSLGGARPAQSEPGAPADDRREAGGGEDLSWDSSAVRAVEGWAAEGGGEEPMPAPTAEKGADPYRATLEASTGAVLIVAEDGRVVFANEAARAWVEQETYPWELAEGTRRIPRKGQALEQHAARTDWAGRRAFFVTLRPAKAEPRRASPKPAEPEPAAPKVDETVLHAAEAALGFVTRAEHQSAWMADVLRSALDLHRLAEADVQPDLVDVLDLANQAVREHRALAMQRGLPLRVASDRKKVIAFVDRNLVRQLLRRIVVDAVQGARHDGVRLRAAVEGDLSVIEAQWHEPSERPDAAEDGHTRLGRRLVERFAERCGGTFAHELDVTGRHTLTVRLPGRPEG